MLSESPVQIVKIAVVMLGILLLAACSPAAETPALSVDTLPPGNAEHGAELFNASSNGAPACSTCHTVDESQVIGPGMAGYGERAGSRMPDKGAAEYTLESIIRPASFLAPGFANVMYTNYAAAFTPQEIADLMAYLLSL
jgi:mono/diheme cytochrome c family protein